MLTPEKGRKKGTKRWCSFTQQVGGIRGKKFSYIVLRKTGDEEEEEWGEEVRSLRDHRPGLEEEDDDDDLGLIKVGEGEGREFEEKECYEEFEDADDDDDYRPAIQVRG